MGDLRVQAPGVLHACDFIGLLQIDWSSPLFDAAGGRGGQPTRLWLYLLLTDYLILLQAGVTVSLDGRRVQAPCGVLDESVCMDLSKFMRSGAKAE